MRSRPTATLYLGLLCRFEPEGVLSFLKVNDSYDIDESLKYCSMHSMNKASAYLLERKGDLEGALDFYLHEINRQLADVNFAEASELNQADDTCSLAISLCVRSSEGKKRDFLRGKDHIVGSFWYKLAMTYVGAYQKGKAGLSCLGRKSLLGYIERVVGAATSYLDSQKLSIYIIDEFQNIPLTDLREVVQVLMDVSSFAMKTSTLAQNISKQECIETIWNSYFHLTRSERL